MNIFRLAGDLSHLLAIIILLIKIWKTRSCAGMFFLLYEFSIKSLHQSYMPSAILFYILFVIVCVF